MKFYGRSNGPSRASLDTPRIGPALEARELYRFYHSATDETFALRGVSLSVAAGEFIAVVGPSGSGKSTLLNCLAGLDEPDGGSVVIAGHLLTRRPEAIRDRLRAENIGVLLQSANLIEHLDVLGNIRAAQSFAARNLRANPEDILRSLGLIERIHARPSTLSGGEVARASLAVAISNSPRVILADEPTGEIDRDAESSLVGLLKQRAARGVAIIVVTHSDEVAAAADRVVEFRDGRITNE